jgi:ABC-type multidrug transport system ATPase subunit
LAGAGVTVLFTTHILAKVERFASHCMLMRNGSIAWQFRVEELPSSLEALYFDSVEGREFEASSWLGWPRS